MENRNPYDSSCVAGSDLPSVVTLRIATAIVALLLTVSGVFIAWVLYEFVSMYFIYAILSVVIAWICVLIACVTRRQVWLLAIQGGGFIVLQIGPIACFVVPGLDRILGAPLRWVGI